MKGNIKVQSVSPMLIGIFSLLLKTKIEFWPLKNQAKTTKKLSIESFEFKKKSDIKMFVV